MPEDSTALLKTCRTINQEASDILYRKVHFTIVINANLGSMSTRLARSGRLFQLIGHCQVMITNAMETPGGVKDLEDLCGILSENRRVKISSVAYLTWTDAKREMVYSPSAVKRRFKHEVSRLKIDLRSGTGYAKVYSAILKQCEKRIKTGRDW